MYLLFAVAVSLVAAVRKRFNAPSHPYPPSPPADPFIGHLRKLAPDSLPELFHAWGRTYGDVIRVWIPTKTLIVINSHDVAMDLLHKTSAKFSSRPTFPLAELMGLRRNTAAEPYGKRLVAQRKLLNQYFHENLVVDYRPLQLSEARIVLRNLLQNPADYDEILNRFSTAIVVKIAFGHDIVATDDGYAQMTREAGTAIDNSGPVGNTVVDFFPFLQHFPSWFPGASYAEYARRARPLIEKVFDFPYVDVKRQLEEGTAQPSLLTDTIQEMNEAASKNEEDIYNLQGAAATTFLAGSDTTRASIATFLLLMVLHPEILKRAQNEIDSVVGSARLPDFNDKHNLPYLECIVYETLRWYPVVPSGLPHLATEDHIYRGMYIPKGSILVANSRAELFTIALDLQVATDPPVKNPAGLQTCRYRLCRARDTGGYG